jgi:2-dehydro-3-deoxygluconokinase
VDRGDRPVTDVYAFGEAMIRLSVGLGESLETSSSFEVHAAGAEANVAMTLSRLGRTVSFASALPDGPLGRRVLTELQAAGVDCSGTVTVPGARMGTYFVELRAEPLPARVIYDRARSAAAGFTIDDVRWDIFDAAGIIHISGITPALSRSCLEVTMEMTQRAREAGKVLSIDVNYRSKLWTPREASRTLSRMIDGAHIVVCTQEDCRDLFDITADPAQAAAKLSSSFGIQQVVVTSGAEGSWWHENGSPGGHFPAIAVEVIDRIGAGDAFMAGVLDGLIDNDLALGVRRGTALAALTLTTRGDRPVALREDIDQLLAGTGRRVDR